MVPGDEGAAFGQALRRADSPEQASDAGAESKRLQEAHRQQMCLQLQAQHKAAHMRLQARLLKLPSRGQPGAVCSIGMPPPKPQPPPRPVITTAALPPPVKAAHLAAAAHLRKLQQLKKAPTLGPTTPGWRRISTQRAGGGQQGSQNAAKQALLQPSATAHVQLLSSAVPAGAKAFKGGVWSQQGAQGHAQRQVPNSGLAQRGSQAGAGQPSREHAVSAAAAPSASSQPQLCAGQPSREHAASAAPTQSASTQPQPGAGQPSREHAVSAAAAPSASSQPQLCAGQPSREHAASAAPTQSASIQPQPGAGQPSREHAASAAAAQSASTQPKGSEHSSAAAAAVASAAQAPSQGGSGQSCRVPSLERFPQELAAGSAAQRAVAGVVNQQPAIAGSTGSLQERVSMRLINKRKRSSSPQRRPHVVDGLRWRPNISNTSATEGALSASAAAQRPGVGPWPAAAQLSDGAPKRPVSNPSNQAEGSSSQRSMPAGTVGQTKSYSRRVPVNPVGYDVRSGEALLSPRKKRIVDWREAQPSAVLPAGFQSPGHQAVSKPEGAARATQRASQRLAAAQDESLRPERYPVHPKPVCIDLPSDQQRQQGSRSRQGVDVPVIQERAPCAAQKPARSKPGQPRDASLTALARAPGTLQEPSKIGVRMPGDPPSPEEAPRGANAGRTLTPAKQLGSVERWPAHLGPAAVSASDNPRPMQRSEQAARCHERLKSKAAAAAACRKPSAQVQQAGLRAPTPVRDSLRKQAAPKRSASAALLLDAPAAEATPRISPGTAADAGGVSRRGRQLKQVVRVDYPLPNTGLRYSKQEAGKGDRWWSKQSGAQSTSPEKASEREKPSTPGAQQGKAAPSLHKGTPSRTLSTTLSRTLSRASSGAGEKAKAKAESLSPQGSKQPVLSPSAMAADKHAQRSRQPPPAVTHRADSAGRKAPPLAPAPAPPLPEAEAARLGVPAALARSLMQAYLPIQAAVQPQQASPPPSPGTIRAHSFSADSKWSWSMAQPSAWEWRQQNAAKGAEHLKTPKPVGRPAQLSCGLPDDEAAACSSQALQQKPGQLGVNASGSSADVCGWKHGAPAQETQQARAQEGQAAGLNPAQMIRTMAGRCVSVGKGALAGLVTRPPSMRVSKRLKFSGPEASAKQDAGGLHSPACASALAAFTAQLAQPDLAQKQMQSQAAAGAAGAAASCGGVSVEVREVHVSSTAGSSQQQAGQGGAPAQQQGGGSDPARSPTATGRAKRLCSAHRPGKRVTPSPSPRKESLRPRRESVVQGLPLKYALAMAISQARDVGSGRRTGIVKQFRGMAFRIAHILRTHQGDDETPRLGLRRQPCPAPDQLSPNTKPSWLPAPATASSPVHASGTEAAVGVSAPGTERSAAPATAEAVQEGAQPSEAVLVVDHGGQAKGRFSRGQKVNYNLHKLTQRAWKGTGALAATQLPPDMDFPGEDDYTGSLLRVQAHCSMRPTADFSISAFCGAVAACVPDPPRLAHARAAADAARTGVRNPGGHRLFELKLEGVCNGIALGALASPLPGVHEPHAPMQQQAWSSEAATDAPAAGAAASSAVQGEESSILPEQLPALVPPSPGAVEAAGASRAAAAVLRAAAGTPGAAQPSAPAARPARTYASDTFACPAPPGSLEFSKSKGPYSLAVPLLGRHALSPTQNDSGHPKDSCVLGSKLGPPMQPEDAHLSQSRMLSSNAAFPVQHEDAQPVKGHILGTATGPPALLGDAQAKTVRILGREPGSPTYLGGAQAKSGHMLSGKPACSAQPEDGQPRKRRRVRVKVVGPQSPQQPAQCPAGGQPSANSQICLPAAASQPEAAQRRAQVHADAGADAARAAQPDMPAEQRGDGLCARITDELAARPCHLGVPPQPPIRKAPHDKDASVKEGLRKQNQRQSPACEAAGAASRPEDSRAGRGQPKQEERAEHLRPLPSGLGGSKLPGKRLACPPKPSHGSDCPEIIGRGAQVAQSAGARAVQGQNADTEMCIVIDLSDELAPRPASESNVKEAIPVVQTIGLPQHHVRSDPRASSTPSVHPGEMANEHPSHRVRLPGLPVKLKLGQPRALGSPQGSRLHLCSQASDLSILQPSSPVAACRT